jgi:hypothetical protein
MTYARWTLITLVTAASIGCAGKLDPNLNYFGSQTMSPVADAGEEEPAPSDAGKPDNRDASVPAKPTNMNPTVNEPEDDAGAFDDDDAGVVAGRGGSTKPDAGPADAGPAKDAAVACDFRGLVQMKCGNLSCHGAPAQTTGLDLTSAGLANRLADRTGSSGCPDHLLIDKADPTQSMLYLKVTGTSCGVKMPLGGSLTTDEQACILSWIEGL